MPLLTMFQPHNLPQDCLLGRDHTCSRATGSTFYSEDDCLKNNSMKKKLCSPRDLHDATSPDISWRQQTTAGEYTPSAHICCQCTSWETTITDWIDHFIVWSEKNYCHSAGCKHHWDAQLVLLIKVLQWHSSTDVPNKYVYIWSCPLLTYAWLKFFDKSCKFLVCCPAKQNLSFWPFPRPCRNKFFHFPKRKTYFLKRCRSSAPSEVVFKVTFSISIHSFRRGSPVRSPVDLRAWPEVDEENMTGNRWKCGVFSWGTEALVYLLTASLFIKLTAWAFLSFFINLN